MRIRDEGMVRNKAVYVALALDCEGNKEVLGLWIERTAGAKFWLRVMNELRNRGVQDIVFAVVDGLKRFPRRSPPPSPGHRPDLHRSSGPPFAELRQLAGPQARRA